MGVGIAHAFLLSGSSVTLVDVSQSAIDAANVKVLESVDNSFARGQVKDVKEVRSRFQISMYPQDTQFCDLIIEAVPEDFELKLKVLSHIDGFIEKDSLLATNTSSFSVTDLALGRKFPSNFVGMHFFNPVPVSLLVEIIHTTHNSQSAIERARTWVEHIQKTPLLVKDSPGFASSRLGVMLGIEAIRMVEEGVATPSDIDAAMTLGYRHPIGPLKLTDMIGLDVRLGIAEYLTRTLGERFEPPALLRQMVESGDLGRKSGKGFYNWSEDGMSN